jgi:hypothetical protein
MFGWLKQATQTVVQRLAVVNGVAVAGSAGSDNAGAAAAGTGAASATGAAASALASGATPPQIPEKYQVKKEDGTLDIEASSLKLAEAYGNLEKRIGTGDIPPKTADEYEITIPDALKSAIDPATDPLIGDFKKDALAAGLTQKQMDFVMGKYFDIAPQLVAGSQRLSADDCVASLKAEWKTDEQYKAEVGKAYKAAVGFAGNDADGIIKDYGNDPRIVRLLARVGSEMGEDRSPNPGGSQTGGASVDALMASEAYNNPRHADHARVSKQVQAHFEAQAKANEKAGAIPVL